LLLCEAVGRPIEIRQGSASVIQAGPTDDGTVAVGGRVEADERRAYDA
jgi:hypothetical protein